MGTTHCFLRLLSLFGDVILFLLEHLYFKGC